MGAKEEGTRVLGHPLYAHSGAEKLPLVPANSSEQTNTPPARMHTHRHTQKAVWEITHQPSAARNGLLPPPPPPSQVNKHCLEELFFKLAQAMSTRSWTKTHKLVELMLDNN